MTEPLANPRLLTTSRAATFRLCPREEHLAYGLGYRPVVVADSLRFGTLWHLMMEAWWIAWKNGMTAQDALARGLAVLPPEVEAFERARLEELLRVYHWRWSKAMEGPDGLEVLGVEVAFAMPMINPDTGRRSMTWDVAGKLDGIVRRRDNGEVLVLEHKTASGDIASGSVYWQRLRMDQQLSIYIDAAKAMGLDPVGCLYDVIGKPLLRPLLATPESERKFKKDGTLYASCRVADETAEEHQVRVRAALDAEPERYFVRQIVPRLDDELDEFRFDLWQTGRMMRDCEMSNRHPRNPNACVRYGRTCDFFNVCTHAASLEDTNLFRRLEDVHPELATPATTEAP